ncbi:hypothetical protein ACPB8Q_07065 [Methanocaldococcus indicus]|uniref:hypothetical protein n=1 Tax=Methanocaldococcus indicus TaxID=213231 RepID=UPI003C6D6B45
MEKLYSKVGDISKLKEIINSLENFTGIIRLDNAFLFYKNSKLIASKLNDKDESLEYIISILPEKFLIEVYKVDDVDNYLNNFKADDFFIEVSKIPIVRNNSIIINKYSDIYKFINDSKVIFYPKRFKNEKFIVIYKNKKEIFCAFFGKKEIFGRRALSKLKTTFAVSEFLVKIDNIDDEQIKKLREEFNNKGFLFIEDDFNSLIKKITQKEPIVYENKSLSDVLDDLSLIKVVGSDVGYIISKNKKPIYAFLKDYEGKKSYRLIKSMCLVEDVKFYIYPLTKEELKAFEIFEDNKIK